MLFRSAATGDRGDGAVGRDLANAAVPPVGDVEIACMVERKGLGLSQLIP